MYDFLLHIYSSWNYLMYPIIVGSSIFEGPIVSIMLGSIIKLGFLNLYLAYAAVMVGDLIGDISLYYLGYKYGDSAIEKVRSKFTITQAQVDTIKEKFRTKTYSILFISKLTNGFGLSSVILLSAGIVRVPLPLFLAVNIVGQLIWSGMLIFVGYHFVGIYEQITVFSGKTTWVILGVIAVLAVYFYHKYKKSV